MNDTIAGVLKSISIQDLAEHEHPAGHGRTRRARWFHLTLVSVDFLLRAEAEHVI